MEQPLQRPLPEEGHRAVRLGSDRPRGEEGLQSGVPPADQPLGARTQGSLGQPRHLFPQGYLLHRGGIWPEADDDQADPLQDRRSAADRLFHRQGH